MRSLFGKWDPRALRAKRREKRKANGRLSKRLTVFCPEQLEERRLLAFSSTVPIIGVMGNMTGDGGGDTLIITVSGGNLQHNRAGDLGFASSTDWDSIVAGNQTIPANTASIINLDTGAGNDIVFWGNTTSAASTLLATLNYGNIAASVGDTITVDDSASAGGKTYNVLPTLISAPGNITVNFAAGTVLTGNKTLITSSGIDTVNVSATQANEAVAIASSGGADNVTIGNLTGVQSIAGNVSISNTGARSNVTVDNSGANGNFTATISDIAGNTTIAAGFAPATIRATTANVAAFVVRGGNGNETFNITPSTDALVALNIQGNIPSATVGDTLNVNLANVASPITVNSTGTGAGNITFGNRTTITFSEIERVTSGGTGLFAVAPINATAGDDVILVAGNGTDTIVSINGNVVFRGPTIEISGNLTINGLGGNDTLTGNFMGGNPIPSGNLVFDAGAGGNDSMVLTGGAFNTIRHFFTNANDGRAEFDGDTTDDGGAGETRIIYAGLDPITDNVSATNRVFTFNNGTDIATLGDDPVGADNMLRITTSNVTSETVDFTTPTASLTVNLDSGGVGNDTLTMNSFDSLSLIAGNITINAGSGNDTIIGNILTPGNLAFNVNINGDADSDQVFILATYSGNVTNINTGAGAGDRVVIGGNATAFNTGTGSLANIRGASINVTDTDIGSLQIDDSGNATAGTFALNALGATPVFGGLGLQFTKTGMTGVINYTRAAISTFQLATGAGNDVIFGNSTNGLPDSAATVPVNTFFANAGNDTFNLIGDGLGGNNDFRGNLGVDQFNLAITTNIGTTNPHAIASLTLRGDDPAGNSTQRDRVTITDGVTARSLNWHYANATVGDLDVEAVSAGTGFFGGAGNGAIPLQIRTMETVILNAGSNNDTNTRVTGTTADDLLTVALRNNNTSALVFRGGTPYLAAPPVTIGDSRPGVAGGGTGPDLLINGIAVGNGVTLFGGGSGASGDRAIVYGASEGNLTDVGNPTNIFGFGAGILQPGFGAGNAYDTFTVTDANVLTTNNSAGTLTPVFLVTANFVQTGPPAAQAAGLTVNGGNESLPQPNNRADVFNATISPFFFIQVNGNEPGLTFDVFAQPQGDELNVTVPGSVNVFSDGASPPTVTVAGIPAITGNFGINFSSIERAVFTPTNGVVNIIGDNNDGNLTQNDLFIVRGRDIDNNGEGVNEFSLQISGNKAGGNGALSSPIFFGNVTRINASGGEALGFDAGGNAIPAIGNTGIDTLDITAYADNTPRGWGIETYFNEGDPVFDGDLLIFNGVVGVSDAIVVAPSGPEAGQVFSNNAATNTPIAVVNYTLNTDIIVNASAPPATPGDTDTLALRGTNPANGNTTGNDFFAVDFGAAGTPAAPLVVVTDSSVAGPPIYTLQNLTNFATVTFEMQGGNDTMTFRTPGNGTFSTGVAQAIVQGGAGDDNVTVNTTGRSVWSNGRLTYDGGTGVDTLNITGNTSLTQVTYTPGPIPGNGQITHAIGAATQFIDFVNLEPVNDDTVAGNLTVNGDNADNAINYGNGGLLNGNLSGIVSIDNQEFIRFANKGNLTINAGAGSDTINLNNPSLPAGLIGNLTVNGGDPTGSDTVIVNGTAAQNNIVVDQFDFDGARIVGAQPVTVIVDTTEHLTINGLGGNDGLRVVGGNSDDVELTPDVFEDAGSIALSASSLGPFQQRLPLNFNNLGAGGNITFASVAGTRNQDLRIFGTAIDDSFTVSAAGVVQVFKAGTGFFVTLPINTPGADELFLEGLAGDDQFDIVGSHPFTGGIKVQAGDPSASDVLNFNGGGNGVTIDLANLTITEAGFGAVSITGVETLNVNALAGNITVLGTTGPDDFNVTPTGANTTIVTLASLSSLTINTTNTGASLLTLNALAGSDTVRVNGQADNDTIAVVRGGNTTVLVDALKLITLPAANTEALVIAAGLGDDAINVTGNGGPISLVVDGGAPSASDTLNITTGASATVTVNYGTDPFTGVVTDNVAGNVTFAAVEHLGLLGTGNASILIINGTGANDAINQSGNLVTVNNGADVTFSTYPTLTLNGNNGDDVINVRPLTLLGVTTFNVNGGDPTASDTLIVNGNATANVIGYNPSDTIGAGNVTITGAPTVNFTTTEAVVIDGQGGNDTLTHTTPAGVHIVTYTPGSSPDSGTILTRQSGNGVALVPLSFSHISGNGAIINFVSAAGREDTLELNGTANSDVFNITGPGNLTQILTTGNLPVTFLMNTAGILNFVARGLDGDDIFNLTGNLPFTTTTIDAGNPSASDVVNLTGAIGNVTIDLNALTVTGYGGTVSLIGVETLNASAGANAIAILGTAGPDNFTTTPTGNTSATTTLASLPTLTINTTNDAASLLTLNSLGGSDNLRVNGTQGNETLTINSTTVVSNTTLFKTITYANTENLQVFGLAGNDTFNVSPSGNTTIFIDGGDPIGSTPGDLLNLNPPGAFQLEPGPENDEGGLVSAGALRVSWDHIEAIAIVGGGPGLILGTNGDDDITIIARDSSTHAGTDGFQDFTVSVNQGPNILFINQPTLFVDALAGDDDVVVRAPAGNGTAWNVQLTIAGGPPSAATGDQGDVFEFETPGIGPDTVVYQPTGSDTGNITLDQSSDSLIQLVNTFTFAPLGYISSPGGFEDFVYDGEGDNDLLTIVGTTGNDTIVHTPSAAFDEGRFRINSLLGMTYQNLGNLATITANGGNGTDTLVYNGTTQSDVFTVAPGSGNVTLLNSNYNHLPIGQQVGGNNTIENLILNGLANDDVFNIAGSLPYVNTLLDGGDPSSSDILNVSGAAANTGTFNLGNQTVVGYGGLISLLGVETVNATGANAVVDTFNVTGYGAFQGGVKTLNLNTADVGGDDSDVINVTATGGLDTITYTPLGTSSARFERSATDAVINITGFNSTGNLTLDAIGSSDQLNVVGSSRPDLITAALVAGNPARTRLTFANNPGAGGLWVPLEFLSVEALDITGGDANDRLDVDNTNGLVAIANGISWDGGIGNDSLRLIGNTTVTTSTYNVGPNVNQGSSVHVLGGATQTVFFNNLEPAVDLVPSATLIVNATNADNAINYSSIGANGLVSVDGFETIEFANKTNLTLNALAGTDTIHLNSSITPPGLTSINVNGNDTTGSDLLMINGVNATTTITLNTSTITGATGAAGAVPIIYSGIEAITAVAGASTTLAVANTSAGAVDYSVTPGVALDEGLIQPNTPGTTIPISFKGFGAGSFINLIGDAGGLNDVITVNGTAANDTFTVAPTTGNVTITGRATVTPTAIEEATLNGLEGDDTFNIAGPQPYVQIFVSGGDPSASDIVNLSAATGAVTVNLADHSLNPTTPASNTQITGYGGTITLTSVEVTNLSVNGNTLTANGTTQPDTFTYSPTGAAAGTFVLGGLAETFNFTTATSTFTINGNIGAPDAVLDDQVIVNGTNNHDFMTVNSPTRTVSVENAAGTLLRSVVLGASVEIVTASAGFGNDTILVIPAPATVTGPGGANQPPQVPAPVLVPLNLLINVDGGAPNASDALVVAQAGGVPLPITDFTVINRSRIQDAGVVRVYRSAVAMPDIVYSNVEVVSPIVPPVDPATGDPQLLILGPDLYEQNEFRATASFLGNVGSTINLTNLAIFPNVEEHRFVPADEDWFRVVAQTTGTLDFQVYFRQFPVGLLPQGGDIDIEVRDASGDFIAGFGANDGTDDERRRIPAVAGQTYFLRVRGANTSVVNGYSVSIVNETTPVPYAMELEDVVVLVDDPAGGVGPGATTTSFSVPVDALGQLSTTDDFYNEKYVHFLDGTAVGQRVEILDYIGATRTFIIEPLSVAPSVNSSFQLESTDTGRSQLDNQTRDNTPTIFFRLDDGILLDDIQGNVPPPAGQNNPPNGVAIPIPFRDQALLPGYRIAIFDEGNVPPQGTTGAPQTPIGFATNVYDSFGVLQQGLYTFTFPTALSDGSHFLSARVQIIDPSSPTQTGFTGRSVPFEIVVDTGAPPIWFGLPNIADDGLDASSDSGVILQPDTFIDNITNDNTPAFFGTAEANSVIRLYVDLNGNDDIDTEDVLIGQGVATPFDGTNQFPFGRWVIQSNVNLNDPRFFNAGNGFPDPDGLRHIMVQAEDVSGNLSAAIDAVAIDIFLDTTGPRVFDVFTIVDTTYELFDPKPSTAGPTPLIDTIDIVFFDLPVRDPNGQFVYPAVNEIVAETIGNYELIGDHTGRALIIDAEVVETVYEPDGLPPDRPDGVYTTVRLTFDKFLPDDRFTLIVNDSIVDDAGNNLDGESQASSPFEESTQQGIIFPSGDGQPGGDFSARFTVDTRPEIGMYAAARVSVDINGNFLWDPEGQDNDTTNRDLQFTLGVVPGVGVLPMNIHDAVFAGDFHSPLLAASGFDKLAAYGFDPTINAYRWLIDINHDGVIDPAAGDVVSIQPAGFQINGIPFAGDWAPGVPGDEIALYDGTSIWLDTTGNNIINGADTRIFTNLRGLPLAGDFDGDGADDFATWKNDFFDFDLDLDGFSDATISFGFPGVSEKPIAADMDQDGITDVGLMVPGRSTTTPPELAEWYILQSNDFGGANRIFGTVNTLDHPFSPVPLGVDLFANFGDEFALPIVGNFDPPVTTGATNNLGVVHMAKEATASSVSGTQTYSYQTMRAGTLSVDVTSASTAGGLTVQLLNNTQQVIASAVSDAQGRVHFEKAFTSASSGVIKVLGAASNVVLHVENVIAENDLLDVDRDGQVSAIDLVTMVSRLNTPSQAALGMSAASDGSIFYDTNQDGYVTAFDLLKIVEKLNRPVAPASSSLVTAASDSSDTSGIALAVSLAPTKTPLTTSDPTSANAKAAAVDSVFASDEDDYQEDSLGETYATSEDEDDAVLVTDLDLEWLE